MRRGWVVGFVVAVAGLLAWGLWPSSPPEVPPSGAVAPGEAAAGAPTRSTPPADRPAASNAPRPAAATSPAASRQATPDPSAEDPWSPELADDPLPARSAWPMSAEGIDGAIGEIRGDLLGCYQVALDEIPGLQGGFQVSFTVEEVDGIGQVTAVEILDHRSTTIEQLRDGPVEECVLDHFQVLEFDAPDGGPVSVRYPLMFTPG